MCEPVSIGMGIASVGSAFAQGSAARKQGKVTATNARNQALYRNEVYNQKVAYQGELQDYLTDRYQKVAASAQNSLIGQFGTVLEQLKQRRDQAMEQAALYDTSAQQSMAQLRAAQSGAASGNSFRLAQQVYEQAASRQIYTTYRNLDAQFRQSQRDMLAMQAQTQSQVNQAMPAPLAPIDPVQPTADVAQPSMLPYVFQGASGILGAAAHAQRIGAFSGPGPATGPMMTNVGGGQGALSSGIPTSTSFTPNFTPTQAPYYIGNF